MNFKQKTTILGAASAVLAALIAIGLIWSPENNAERSAAGAIAAFAEGEPLSMSIGDAGGQSIELSLESGAWILSAPEGKLPVKEDRVAAFIKAVLSVDRLYPAASSKDSWTSLGLDEAQGKRVRIVGQGGKILADFSAGKMTASGDRVYIRKEGSDASYEVAAGFMGYIGYGRKPWLVLSVFGGIPAEDVQGIEVTAALDFKGEQPKRIDASYAIDRNERTVWSLRGKADQALSPEAVDAMIRSACSLEAEDFVPAAEADPGMVKSAASLVLILGDGRRMEMRLSAPKDDGSCYLRIAGNPYSYRIGAWAVKNLFKTLAELQPAPPLAESAPVP